MLEYVDKLNKKSIQVPEYVVIWLHGLGADGYDFIPIIDVLNINKAVKFIFPHAPLRAITINNGYTMRGWYDIHNLSSMRDNIDEDGILESVQQIEELIYAQIKSGINPNKILIAGFSQGGVLGYALARFSQYKFAGIIALSCYLPDFKYNEKNSVNQDTQIFAAHGVEDNVVPFAAGIDAYEKMQKLEFKNTTWHKYHMEHGVCEDLIEDLSSWLNKICL